MALGLLFLYPPHSWVSLTSSLQVGFSTSAGTWEGTDQQLLVELTLGIWYSINNQGSVQLEARLETQGAWWGAGGQGQLGKQAALPA